MSDNTNPLAKGKRLQLGLLALLFLFPPAVAYVLFYMDVRPSSGSSYGQLVQPVKSLKDTYLQTLDGQSFRFSELKKKWTMLYVGESHCDESCNKNLYKIHQIRLAQGKNMGRVNSVYIVPADTPSSEVNKVGELYPGIMILLAQQQAFTDLIVQLYDNKRTASQAIERVYIMDPVGNVMMMYQAEADPTGIKKDLMRLLKISQVG